MPTALEHNLGIALAEFDHFFINTDCSMHGRHTAQQRRKKAQQLQNYLKRYIDELRRCPDRATSNIAQPTLLTNPSGIILATGGAVDEAVKRLRIGDQPKRE